ncbi:MAG: glycoside hydrolase family 3 N-terminal domain-containing protein [Bacteroidales bacterium]
MKKSFITMVLLISAGLVMYAQQGVKPLPVLGRDPVSKVVAAMTPDEKVSLVVGAGMRMPGPPPGPGNPVSGQTHDLVPGAAGTTHAIIRLGIPAIIVADGPAGLRIRPTRPDDDATYYCTAFPVATLLASTWDTELVNKVGRAMGEEVLEYGVDILLGPGMNIQRNPLCGRNFEYYSEDPLITGRMAAAMVKGVQSNGVGTSVKHFDANNAETNRNSLNTIVSERTLREIYLKGFGIAVQEAQPWTVMSSYNMINGIYAAENYDLLTKVLRNDWGFRGFVMTDWFGGRDPVAMMKAGNDLLMPGTPDQSNAILEALKSGTLDVRVLDSNVERILNIVVKSPKFKGYKFSNKPDLPAHALVDRQAGSEGMVLLKNDNNALPFTGDIKKLAVFGNSSYDMITGGTGSGDVNEAYSVSLIEGLQNADLVVDANLKSLYEAYLKAVKEGMPGVRDFMMVPAPIAELEVNSDVINTIVGNTDAAIITIGRISGEGKDRTDEKGDFRLSDSEKALISSVTSAYHAQSKQAVVILNIGGVIETASWRDIPDAILLAWQAGQETGNSIADILVGNVNPSGKLAITFPVNYQDEPSAKNFPGKVLARPQSQTENQGENMGGFMRARPAEVVYEEGIYDGYRYFTTFKVPVAYEFGYGKSYTVFEYSNLKLSSKKFSNRLTFTVDVKNAGLVDGREVAQIYISAPSKGLDKPVIELKAFGKTKSLRPEESQTLSFELTGKDLASFDTKLSAWVAEAGSYTVKVGASSADIRQTATFDLGRDLTVKKEMPALLPQEKINELKPQ